MPEPVLELVAIQKRFRLRREGRWDWLYAVQNLDLTVMPGQVHGVVGESGSGKSTVARVATRLYKPDAGKILWSGQDVSSMPERHLRPLRRQIQMVFQDPYSSLNPRQKVGSALREPLQVHAQGTRQSRQEAAVRMLDQVGLSATALDKYPHQFSGGQRQRICIARALMLRPQLVVLDEAVSALDVSVQAQILALLEQLRREFDLAYLFISHDLEVMRLVADQVSVMYAGQIVETGAVASVYEHPRHPYTRRLLDARPGRGSQAETSRLAGAGVASASSGCAFAPRCPEATSDCAVLPAWQGTQQRFRCHYPLPAPKESS